MKKKMILLLLACMMATGCGKGEQGNPQEPSQMIETSSEEAIYESESDKESQDNMDEKDNRQEEASSQGEGTVQKLGAKSGDVLAPVTLITQWQRAAYFADRVFDMTQENTLVSPISLEIALGLAAEGAEGETAKELYGYLGDEDYGDYVKEYMDFAESLDQGEDTEIISSSKYTFHYQIANSIWVREGEKLCSEFIKAAGEKFSAQAQNVNFVAKAKETADLINSWCAEKTHNLIKEIVTENSFSPDLETIIINSLYFESPWMDSWVRYDHEFKNAAGVTKTLEMMRSSGDVYFENDHATAFAKEYYNGFEFIGILPKAEGEFSISDLDLESLMASRTTDYDVLQIAPKLDFDTTADNIVSILKAQGVNKAFEDDAQFTKLIENMPVHISDIVQKCKIEMDEDGTRAAAVTAIMTLGNCIEAPDPREIKEVYLDRPFAFMIYDTTNEKIVFIGKVTDLQ